MKLVGLGEKSIDTAIIRLRQATRNETAGAYLWSDLSAAYLARARRGRTTDVLPALSAALRAVKSAPPLLEARFNLALAYEACSLNADAHRAWVEYRQVDPRSGWASEAAAHQQRLERLSARTRFEAERPRLDRAALSLNVATVREIVGEYSFRSRDHAENELLPQWAAAFLARRNAEAERTLRMARTIGATLATDHGEYMVEDAITVLDQEARVSYRRERLATLAGAYQRLAAGGALCQDNEATQGQRLLEVARQIFEDAHSSSGLWARYHLAVCAFQGTGARSAVKLLTVLLREPSIERYPSLVGRIHWMTGLALMVLAQPGPAEEAYERALRVFENTGSLPEVGGICNLLADNQGFLGEEERVWEFLHRALAIAVAEGDDRRQYAAFDHAANASDRLGLSDVALLFRNAVVRLAMEKPDPPGEAHALLRRAETRFRLGQRQRALADLVRSMAACARIVDQDERRRREADILRAEGKIRAVSDPGTAIPILTRALRLYLAADYRYPLASTYLERARAFKTAGEAAAAELDLRAGIADFERQRLLVRNEELRITYFDQARDLFDQLIDLQASRPGGEDAAFSSAERQRARVLLDRLSASGAGAAARIQPLAPEKIRCVLPAGVVLIAYSSLPDRLLIWILRAQARTHMISQPVGTQRLEREVATLERRLESRVADRALWPSLEALHRTLLQPVLPYLQTGDRIVFVPDKSLNRVSFAALRDPVTHRYLVEDYASAVTPSASLYVASATEPSPGEPVPQDLLVVADPRFDRARFPELPSLPGSRQEARALLSLFGNRGLILEDADATPAAFDREAGRHAFVHLATHAEANPAHPNLSRLLLAPVTAEDSGLLSAGAIQALRFPRTRLVYLAACRSGEGRIASEGTLSLARAFLAAGVREVVASLWEIDDSTAGKISQQLYRRLLQGDSAEDALRHAQMAAIQSAERLSSLADWASFVVSLGPHGNFVSETVYKK